MFNNLRDAIGVWMLYLTLRTFSTQCQKMLGPKVLSFLEEMEKAEQCSTK